MAHQLSTLTVTRSYATGSGRIRAARLSSFSPPFRKHTRPRAWTALLMHQCVDLYETRGSVSGCRHRAGRPVLNQCGNVRFSQDVGSGSRQADPCQQVSQETELRNLFVSEERLGWYPGLPLMVTASCLTTPSSTTVSCSSKSPTLHLTVSSDRRNSRTENRILVHRRMSLILPVPIKTLLRSMNSFRDTIESPWGTYPRRMTLLNPANASITS